MCMVNYSLCMLQRFFAFNVLLCAASLPRLSCANSAAWNPAPCLGVYGYTMRRKRAAPAYPGLWAAIAPPRPSAPCGR